VLNVTHGVLLRSWGDLRTQLVICQTFPRNDSALNCPRKVRQFRSPKLDFDFERVRLAVKLDKGDPS
jgi:hypothetical protein